MEQDAQRRFGYASLSGSSRVAAGAARLVSARLFRSLTTPMALSQALHEIPYVLGCMTEPCFVQKVHPLFAREIQAVGPGSNTCLGDALLARADRKDQWRLHTDQAGKRGIGQATIFKRLMEELAQGHKARA